MPGLFDQSVKNSNKLHFHGSFYQYFRPFDQELMASCCTTFEATELLENGDFSCNKEEEGKDR